MCTIHHHLWDVFSDEAADWQLEIFQYTSQLIAVCFTVSVGKIFGSKGKQHNKQTAFETQIHNQ